MFVKKTKSTYGQEAKFPFVNLTWEATLAYWRTVLASFAHISKSIIKKKQNLTLSLVIHEVRFKIKPAKKYISIWKLRKPSICFCDNWVSSCLSFFLSAFTAATHMYNYYNYSPTLFKTINFFGDNWVFSCLSFFLSASTAATQMYNYYNYSRPLFKTINFFLW